MNVFCSLRSREVGSDPRTVRQIGFIASPGYLRPGPSSCGHWSGDPLSPASQALHTLAIGSLTFANQRARELALYLRVPTVRPVDVVSKLF